MKAIIFPGQGAQFKGMGKDLFRAYPKLATRASEILGYSIEKLCVEDPKNELRLTQFTQPALFVVGALGFYKMRDEKPQEFSVDYLAGHSLGEYNALLAAEAFDFETGVKLVKKRGELMGAAQGGGMAAVIGLAADEVSKILKDNQLDDIDIANFNTPTQLVVAGPMPSILKAEKIFSARNGRYVVLNVSAPFHSRYMKQAQESFFEFLQGFTFNDVKVPVIANTTARPYATGRIAETLSSQIAGSVRWTDSIRYLMGKGDISYLEVGSTILTKMVTEIQKTESPIFDDTSVAAKAEEKTENDAVKADVVAIAPTEKAHEAKSIHLISNTVNDADIENEGSLETPKISAASLGSKIFKDRFGLKYAYVTGAMYRGIASPALVVRMGKAGMMGFFGTGGLSLANIESGIKTIQSQLNHGEAYGINLLANYDYPELEQATIDLYLKYGVRVIEAAAFMQMTAPIVLFRLKGLSKDKNGKVICSNKVLAKISRPEVAEVFMSPAPTHIVEQLLKDGLITNEQAELAKLVPMSHDICVEADSGGHTDGGISTVMLSAMSRLKNDITKKYAYQDPICMGLAGGIGSPEGAAAAFIMGADFIMTGSINQCTVEGGISEDVKNLLQEINIQDTEYAPAGDMFEIGAKVQVLKKGVFFPARANKLFSLYSHYNSLDEIPEKTRNQLQNSVFKKSFAEIWKETAAFLESQNKHHEVSKAEANPKHKMALVFRWYFGYSTRLASEGKAEDRVNYQVHTGPALGAFNQWVKGTDLESWKNRHVDEIGEKMMKGAADHLTKSLSGLLNATLSPQRMMQSDEKLNPAPAMVVA